MRTQSHSRSYYSQIAFRISAYRRMVDKNKMLKFEELSSCWHNFPLSCPLSKNDFLICFTADTQAHIRNLPEWKYVISKNVNSQMVKQWTKTEERNKWIFFYYYAIFCIFFSFLDEFGSESTKCGHKSARESYERNTFLMAFSFPFHFIIKYEIDFLCFFLEFEDPSVL